VTARLRADYVKYSFPIATSMTLLAWSLVEFSGGYAAGGAANSALSQLRWGADYLMRAHTSPSSFVVQVGLQSSAYWAGGGVGGRRWEALDGKGAARHLLALVPVLVPLVVPWGGMYIEGHAVGLLMWLIGCAAPATASLTSRVNNRPSSCLSALHYAVMVCHRLVMPVTTCPSISTHALAVGANHQTCQSTGE